MCDQCEQTKSSVKGHLINRRWKLWEIKPHFHCAILGTCLSMDDLRKVMRQSGITLASRHSDYELHTTMVGQAEEKSGAARNLHKMLDRKYKRWIQALARCKEQKKLEQHWRDALDSGDIAGTFWALMTHPFASPELLRKAYGHVHMLSHLQGASNRADLKRMKVLEAKLTELQDTLSTNRQNHNEQLMRRDEILQKQEQEIHVLKINQVRHEPSDTTDFVDELKRQNQQLTYRVDWAESQLAERDMRTCALQEEIIGLKELLEETRVEHAAMEQAMMRLLADQQPNESEPAVVMDLNGKRILYVGGRTTLAPHLRSLVELHNGRFDHHDGGLEDRRAALQCNLAGADMVFCPIDCISHDACLRVKRYCQQQAKPFIPLRSSGLSTFAAGLRKFSNVRADPGISPPAYENLADVS